MKMKVKCKPVFLGLAVAALLVPVFAVSEPASATAEKAPSCPRVLVIGLHGAGEGPSANEPKAKKSPTIQTTFKAFENEVKKLPNDGTSHDYQLKWFSYPTVPGGDLHSVKGLKNAVHTIANTATKLYDYVASRVDPCASRGTNTLVSVVGYSMGAWVINVALTNHYYMAGLLNLVLLEGDPCWSKLSDQSAGLTQRAQEARVQLGCLSADVYPDFGFATPYYPRALCASKDPVCGEGFSVLTLKQQLDAAKKCSPSNGCPHFAYPKDGEAAKGGKWLADYAFT